MQSTDQKGSLLQGINLLEIVEKRSYLDTHEYYECVSERDDLTSTALIR